MTHVHPHRLTKWLSLPFRPIGQAVTGTSRSELWSNEGHMKRTLGKHGQIERVILINLRYGQSNRMPGHLTDLSKTGSHNLESQLFCLV